MSGSTIIGLFFLAFSTLGVFWHVQASIGKGRFVGTGREYKFVIGTFMALVFFPAAIVAFIF